MQRPELTYLQEIPSFTKFGQYFLILLALLLYPLQAMTPHVMRTNGTTRIQLYVFMRPSCEPIDHTYSVAIPILGFFLVLSCPPKGGWTQTNQARIRSITEVSCKLGQQEYRAMQAIQYVDIQLFHQYYYILGPCSFDVSTACILKSSYSNHHLIIVATGK